MARCTVAWLMRRMRLYGVLRGRKVHTTVPGPVAACLLTALTASSVHRGPMRCGSVISPMSRPDRGSST